MFQLSEKLQADTFFICDLKISRLLLMNDAGYPWLILVPRRADLLELIDLPFEEQIEVLREVNLIGKILKENFGAEKLNIAALGNVVKQLHIHVVGRFASDATFPKPVWGNAPAQPYGEKEMMVFINKINFALTMEQELFRKKLIYRSTHRGCKETDFLIGEFAKKSLPEMQNLEIFSQFLEEDDLKIYDWILGKAEMEKKYLELISDIRNFHGILAGDKDRPLQSDSV